MARKSYDELPNQKRSLHYGQICRDGVQANIRKLAAFDASDIPVGYIRLLEGIFVIMLGTFGFPGRYGKWNPKPSYDLVEGVRSSLCLPPVSWIGMNCASPLYQGFSASNAGPSECANPNCTEMTYPRGHRLSGRRRRHFYEQGNPLGSYLCDICFTCARHRAGRLPSKQVYQKLKQRPLLRQAAGPDAECSCCGELESQSLVKREQHHQVHVELPDWLLCIACLCFYKKQKRLRTPEKVELHLITSANAVASLGGVKIYCDNCQVSQDEPGGAYIEFNQTCLLMLCRPCKGVYKKTGNHRDTTIRRPGGVSNPGLLATMAIAADRRTGKEIACSNCHRVENPNGPKWTVKSNRVLCDRCRNGYGDNQKQIR